MRVPDVVRATCADLIWFQSHLSLVQRTNLVIYRRPIVWVGDGTLFARNPTDYNILLRP